jgi:hypothetical protein
LGNDAEFVVRLNAARQDQAEPIRAELKALAPYVRTIRRLVRPEVPHSARLAAAEAALATDGCFFLHLARKFHPNLARTAL